MTGRSHSNRLVYPGIGWVVFRAAEYLPEELVFNINYLGADQSSFTLNFSKGASQVIGQYYQLIRLGRKGYHAIMSNLTRTADYLAASLEDQGFIIMSKKSGQGLPLVAFRLKENPEREYDEFALARQLRMRGFIVPAYTMAPNTKNLKMLRVVVREDFTKTRCDSLIKDIRLCTSMLDDMDKETIRKHDEIIKRHTVNSEQSKHNHKKFQVRQSTLFRWAIALLTDTYSRTRATRCRASTERPTRSARRVRVWASYKSI